MLHFHIPRLFHPFILFISDVSHEGSTRNIAGICMEKYILNIIDGLTSLNKQRIVLLKQVWIWLKMPWTLIVNALSSFNPCIKCC